VVKEKENMEDTVDNDNDIRNSKRRKMKIESSSGSEPDEPSDNKAQIKPGKNFIITEFYSFVTSF
jgi:hypothetical protein